MSQHDPTGMETSDEALLEPNGQCSYEEVSRMTNGELGIVEAWVRRTGGALQLLPLGEELPML